MDGMHYTDNGETKGIYIENNCAVGFVRVFSTHF